MITTRLSQSVRMLGILLVCLFIVPAFAQTATPTGGTCTLNGKTRKNCTAGMQKQALRQAARAKARAAKKRVAVTFAGVNKTATTTGTTLTTSGTMQMSAAPLAVTSAALPMATMTVGAKPDYFGMPNYANSPLPTVDPATGVVSGGMRKFVDQLPGICDVTGANGLGQCIPLAVPDKTTFPGSDYYQIGLKEYTIKMHSDLPPTPVRGYYDKNATSFAGNHYLGPLILATRNRPVRVLFSNELTQRLNIPLDDTYMGAGMVKDGVTTSMASDKRAVLHLHGGNTPWISDGTTMQWVTPIGGDGQPAKVGFSKGFSFQNVPDMVGAGKPIPTPSLTDGVGTYLWTNQQSGRLMFYHDHAYGITRLNVYAGEAAGYLLVDPIQEAGLAGAGVPGFIVTNPADGSVTSADLGHLLPLVIQDKTFVPDNGDPGGQLAATDPTWDVANWGGAGSLWYPHVYMPNQNPADMSGANGFGRWDYGPWFWPPQDPSTFVPGGQPYACTSAGEPAGGWAFPPLMCPGAPLPSGVPEGFMDTPVINGTALPTLSVDPTAYRFQVLNAANDRTINLGLYIAEPLTISVTVAGSGYDFNNPPAVTVTGCSTVGTTKPLVDASGAIASIAYSGFASCTAPTVSIAAPTLAGGVQAFAIASADSDVKMIPAVAALSRNPYIPDCTQINPIGNEGLGLALFDAAGNPLNNTGLPPNCWPQYNSTITGRLSWPTDGRDGGVPDPGTAGPPIIQIGTEGGLLPSPVVIPSTPVSFDYNKRSITVLNVLNHGLYMGPAERADVVIDFSAFAGKTLILYNDSPAPVPAGDPRIDYYTNDPDNTGTGGAPSTIAGFAPNTRTMMQIKVGSACTSACGTFSLPALKAALPALFTQTQDPIIVPERAYPVGNGNSSSDTYVRIQDTTAAIPNGQVGAITVTNGGGGYTTLPAVTITGGNGTGATATAIMGGAAVASLALNNGGTGYTSAPTVSLTGGGGTGATATAALAATGSVKSVAVATQGSGYTSIPTVTFSAPQTVGAIRATGTATVSNRRVTAITITNAGNGYTAAPTITFTGGGGTGATANATLGKAVGSLTLTNAGSNYTTAPTIAFTGGAGSGASASATLAGHVIAGVTVVNPGTGYTSIPTVTIAPPTAGSQATATAVLGKTTVDLLPKTIQELFTTDYGRMNATLGVELPFTNFLTQTTIPYGYVDPPTEVFKEGETQFWKITHNGVDTHFIHFHLFTVQVINRVGWDGAIKPPDPDELSWKDTVRMNPLEDVVVAIRPMRQIDTLGVTGVPGAPFNLPNSVRPLDVTMPIGSSVANEFTNLDPANNPVTVTNSLVNFGWEYVWHCHILGHEENDMMRAMAMAVPPAPATALAAVLSGTGKGQQVNLSWANNAINQTGFTVLRSTTAAGPFAMIGTVGPNVTTFVDKSIARRTTYYYQVVANNVVGYTQGFPAPAVGYPVRSADSAASNTATAVTQ